MGYSRNLARFGFCKMFSSETENVSRKYRSYPKVQGYFRSVPHAPHRTFASVLPELDSGINLKRLFEMPVSQNVKWTLRYNLKEPLGSSDKGIPIL